MLAANCPRKLTRVRALTGIFLVVGMRATLLAHTLAAALAGKGHAFGGGGTGSALAVSFSNDFVAHGNLSSLIKLAIVTHSLGLFLEEKNGLRIWVLAGPSSERPASLHSLVVERWTARSNGG